MVKSKKTKSKKRYSTYLEEKEAEALEAEAKRRFASESYILRLAWIEKMNRLQKGE